MSSEKRDYSDLLDSKEGTDLEDSVRKLMEGLHKSMLKQLSRGEHDPAIEQRMGADIFRVDASASKLEPPTITEEEPPSPLVDVPTGASPIASPPPLSASLPPAAVLNTDEPALAEPTRLEVEGATGTETETVSRLSRVFGDRVVSEKPLDEVVLDYLVENARKRKRTTK